ncbi:sulfatase family protein [Pelagicoccus mobilis]|uniref:Sulfatase n=1 Tax=Pelagicoccus mobilis TaxID=415221 RepID=A0A934VPQ2_9BACT|nr:sulfatase [Pelagicoccus mobilis]MBK1876050.1 sulfatase [Pelagicoccus mobilis]
MSLGAAVRSIVSLVGLYFVVANPLLAAKKRPNILFIMSDDHTWQAVGSYGSRLKEYAPTRNIDRLANEGMLFKNVFCTNSICTPSRASILSGQYSHKNGLMTLVDTWNRDHQPNMAVEFQNAGYQTAIIGKWHLHSEPIGFDYYKVLPGQGLYFDPLLKEKGKPWQDHNDGGEPFKGHSSDVIADETLKWLDSQRDVEKPFFLMCHFKAPHGLWEYAPRFADMYEGVHIPEPHSLFEDKSDRSDGSRDFGSTVSPTNKVRNRVERMQGEFWPNGSLDIRGMDTIEQTKAAYQRYLKDYLRCVAGVDENVGRVLDYLKEEGLYDDTLIVYTGDQGMMLGEHDHVDKRWAFEESLRMPFIVRYPGMVEANSINKDIINNVDFAPTLLDFAGVEIPGEMQGRSFLKGLKGKTPKGWRQSTYYRYWMHRAHHDIPAHYAIRTERFKLIFYYGLALHPRMDEIWAHGPGEEINEQNLHQVSSWGATRPEATPARLELFDLEKDPYEQNNVYGDPAYEKVVEELKAQLLELKVHVGDLDEAYPELLERRNSVW